MDKIKASVKKWGTIMAYLMKIKIVLYHFEHSSLKVAVIEV